MNFKDFQLKHLSDKAISTSITYCFNHLAPKMLIINCSKFSLTLYNVDTYHGHNHDFFSGGGNTFRNFLKISSENGEK